MRKEILNNRGQSLVELVVGVSVAAIIIGAVTGTSIIILRSNVQTKRLQAAANLSQELSDNLRSFAESDWRNIYDLAHGSGNHFYLNTATSPFSTSTGDETIAVEGVNYTRYFYVENVNRDLCGVGAVTTAATTTCASGPDQTGVADDPSTQKATVTVTWPDSAGITLVEYLSRSRANTFRQTDWIGGSGQESFNGVINNKFASSTTGTPGGIDFTSTPGSIKVTF